MGSFMPNSILIGVPAMPSFTMLMVITMMMEDAGTKAK